MLTRVVQVVPQRDHQVFVYFEDGKIVRYDATKLLKKRVFQPLNDINLFMSTCTVMNHTLAWDLSGDRDPANCLDIDPETLHELPPEEDILKS
ncbi:MAG: DUF2442 domain-containing protein [Eubacteriales bacterium]|nr:DUF2442 domain-containing protein [Eubacteriales bacterium]